MATAVERQAMREAIALAADARFMVGENPRVGCVVIDGAGNIVGEGAHLGDGTAHAEVVALAAAGPLAMGATVVVTMEPCAHHGKTPPCVEALLQAGVSRVVFGQHDPNPVAGGGAQRLRAAGVQVEGDVLAPDVHPLNREWSIAVARRSPFVTLKVAATLDGLVAALDGSSRWITGPSARHDSHDIRSQVGAVLVGTGTALADDPQLTDRRGGAVHQPRPAVMGFRELPTTSALAGRDPILCRTHDPAVTLATLWQHGVRHVLVEGGPTIATAFLAGRHVDRVVWYASPKLLGAGAHAVGELGISTLADAQSFALTSCRVVGDDIRIELEPQESTERGG